MFNYVYVTNVRIQVNSFYYLAVFPSSVFASFFYYVFPGFIITGAAAQSCQQHTHLPTKVKAFRSTHAHIVLVSFR